MAWPYVLPWYDGLGWALLALLPLPTLGRAAVQGASAQGAAVPRAAVPGAAGQGAPVGGAAPGAAALGRVTGAVVLWRGRAVGLVVALDWLMLARTTALGFGYLPARGISMPPDLAWLRPVFRNAVTPLALLTILVILLLLLLRRPRGVEDVEAALSDTRATG
jgi:hypothetical protein